MIETIEISNYSTNKKLGIKFGPCVTSIIGRSFKGKSAFIRAMKWLCLNTPAGTSFINWDANKAAVRLGVDGNKFTRKRSKSSNIYKCNKKSFTAFGNGVPPLIKDKLNMAELNFQGQHDTPFWFAETAGEVSRQLNSIINLEKIDTTLADIASKMRKTTSSIEVLEGQLEESIKDKNNLAYAKRMDKQLVVIEGVDFGRQTAATRRGELAELCQAVFKHISRAKKAREVILNSQNVLEIGDKHRELAVTTKSLQTCIGELTKQKTITKLKVPPISGLKQLKNEILVLDDDKFELKYLIRDIKNKKELVCQMEEKSQKQSKLLKAFKVCPLCQKTM